MERQCVCVCLRVFLNRYELLSVTNNNHVCLHNVTMCNTYPCALIYIGETWKYVCSYDTFFEHGLCATGKSKILCSQKICWRKNIRTFTSHQYARDVEAILTEGELKDY